MLVSKVACVLRCDSAKVLLFSRKYSRIQRCVKGSTVYRECRQTDRHFSSVLLGFKLCPYQISLYVAGSKFLSSCFTCGYGSVDPHSLVDDETTLGPFLHLTCVMTYWRHTKRFQRYPKACKCPETVFTACIGSLSLHQGCHAEMATVD